MVPELVGHRLLAVGPQTLAELGDVHGQSDRNCQRAEDDEDCIDHCLAPLGLPSGLYSPISPTPHPGYRFGTEFAHARPPALRSHRQPHRRRRGGRASGERGQGTGRERARCRRAPHRRAHRRRRAAADPRHRRRRGHEARRSGARGRTPCHIETRRRRSGVDPHAGFSRRGAAVDRFGGAAVDHDAARRRAARLGDRGRCRREVAVKPAALGEAPASRCATCFTPRRRG